MNNRIDTRALKFNVVEFHQFVYTGGHPNTSILTSGQPDQATGCRRRHSAVIGVGSWFSTTLVLSMLAGNVCKRKT